MIRKLVTAMEVRKQRSNLRTINALERERESEKETKEEQYLKGTGNKVLGGSERN